MSEINSSAMQQAEGAIRAAILVSAQADGVPLGEERIVQIMAVAQGRLRGLPPSELSNIGSNQSMLGDIVRTSFATVGTATQQEREAIIARLNEQRGGGEHGAGGTGRGGDDPEHKERSRSNLYRAMAIQSQYSQRNADAGISQETFTRLAAQGFNAEQILQAAQIAQRLGLAGNERAMQLAARIENTAPGSTNFLKRAQDLSQRAIEAEARGDHAGAAALRREEREIVRRGIETAPETVRPGLTELNDLRQRNNELHISPTSPAAQRNHEQELARLAERPETRERAQQAQRVLRSSTETVTTDTATKAKVDDEFAAANAPRTGTTPSPPAPVETAATPQRPPTVAQSQPAAAPRVG